MNNLTASRTKFPQAQAKLHLPAISREWLSVWDPDKSGDTLSQITESPGPIICITSAKLAAEISQSNRFPILFSVALREKEQFSYIDPKAVDTRRFLIKTEKLHPEVSRFYFPLSDDGKNPASTLLECYQTFKQIVKENSDKPILVHCQAGISRSLSLVAALISEELQESGLADASFETAVTEFISPYRAPGIDPDFACSLCAACAIKIDRETSA